MKIWNIGPITCPDGKVSNMILDFFKAQKAESKPSRFTILVDGHGRYTVESNRGFYQGYAIATCIPHETAKVYFTDREYETAERAKKSIDEFLKLESLNATRPVCQYP